MPEEAEEEHALLAAALASSLEPLPDGAEIAEAAGRSWGRVLVERLEPGRRPDEEACVERIAVLLRRRGFAPERAPDGLVMHRCPFRELAERYPRVVCSLHAGLIDGALEELDAPVALESLEPWASPSTCVAHLAPRAATQRLSAAQLVGDGLGSARQRSRVGSVSCTTSTGHEAWRMTALETLPSRSDATVPYPRVPIAISRASISSA